MKYDVIATDYGLQVTYGKEVTKVKKIDISGVTYTSPYIYFATASNSRACIIDTQKPIYYNGVLQDNLSAFLETLRTSFYVMN
jgi:hypothetical protein